ncbi:MurR/RpiR family transcriptional regulator [Peribacillus asahii]|uniref:SIS domain protein n=1 Tax=Peribacillus asahii TaxID=228899 RepID=A0A3T0KPY5_9BACI|nr:MurR/RpiR family transcriptional regulator [Peribacillus asahii]AZV42460.1 SIS domain protein [Peribacillus asahii]USK86751.1 MurR/RpiR family transcriptional regulator [Peribacillus asahii]
MNLKALIQEKYNELSNGQKKVAAHLLENSKDFAVNSASEIGVTVGVSETTVIRFCYSIGLSGFSELQKMVREQLLFNESSLGNYVSGKLKLAEQPNFFAQAMEQDRQCIQETINHMSEKDFDIAVQKLVDAKRIYISGLRGSFSAANWLTFTLGLVRKNVEILRPETNDLLYTLSEMDHQSILISISFHRYLKETIKIAELAKKQGAFIIGISDSPLAPIRDYSDLLFQIYSNGKSTIDAGPALFSFLNALVAGVSVKDRERFEKRKAEYEKLNGDYYFS